VVVNRDYDRGTLSITGNLFRNSGDRQLNEDLLIFVDDRQVFASYDSPDCGERELIDPLEVALDAGEHNVLVRHGDDSKEPDSPGSIEADIVLSYVSGH
jgi:hypothetical protein